MKLQSLLHLTLGVFLLSSSTASHAQNAATVSISSETASGVQRETFSGARWVWSVDRTSPRVAFSVLVRVGAGDETFTTAGWRRVLAQAMLNATQMTSGALTKEQTKAQRDAQLEPWGARLGATVNDDAIEFWATGDSANAVRVLDALLQVLRAPRLSDGDIAAARNVVRSQRQATYNDVASLATEVLDSRLYRDFNNRPIAYGLPDVGSKEALDTLSSSQLREWHARWFRPANFTLGASGDLNVGALRAVLQNRFKAWGASGVSSLQANPPLFSGVADAAPATLTRELGVGAGDWVFVSYRVSDAAQNDLPALQVLAAALGASPLGRVPERLLSGSNVSSRNGSSTRTIPRSAAQQAAVVLVPRRWGGELVLFAQAQSRLLGRNAVSVERLREALLEEAQKLRAQPLSENELRRARRYAMGTWALDRESLRSRSFRLALDEEWRSAASTRPVWMSSGRTERTADESWAQRVQNVSASQVQNVAKRYLNTGATVFVRSTTGGIGSEMEDGADGVKGGEEQ